MLPLALQSLQKDPVYFRPLIYRMAITLQPPRCRSVTVSFQCRHYLLIIHSPIVVGLELKMVTKMQKPKDATCG